jgi:hypothetical protein
MWRNIVARSHNRFAVDATVHSVCVEESPDTVSCAAQQCFYGKFISAATMQITRAGL